MAYIHYDTKANGVAYASVYESYCLEGKVKTKRIETLGRVVDKENGIFSLKGNTYKYSVENGREPVPDAYRNTGSSGEEMLILDFGDAWFLEQYLPTLPFYPSIENLLPGEKGI